jgi:tetratricopeptide (TPR) repeat protein
MSDNGYYDESFADGAHMFVKGEFEKSASHFASAIEHHPEFVLAYLSRGVVYAKMGKVDLALADFERAIEMEPENARAYHLRGLARLRLGEREKAVQDFDKAIELNPQYAVAYYSRGTTYSELGIEDRAGNDMLTAARLGEANLQGFADDHNIWRTKYHKVEAEVMGERERDWAVTPDLRSWLDG